MSGSDPVVALQGLAKSYGSVHALRGLDLEVQRGPVGLLGPNGAGKTTLIKLLLGLLRPDQGGARVAGLDPTDRRERLEVRRAVGYMPEGDCLVPGMTAVELVTTLGRLTGMTYRDAITRAHEVLDYVDLEEARYRGLDEYSTGMKQRLKLAQALVHDPDFLLLDEPTNGLDPKGRRQMLDLVHDLGHEQGKSLLVCSHLLPDVERTCEDIVVLHRGRVLHTGAIAEMTRRSEAWLQVEVAERPDAFRAALEAEGLAFETEGSLGFRVEVEADPRHAGDALFAVAERAGTALTQLSPVRASLEEAFLDFVDQAEEKA
ncbi:MAG: ABC transporter ATP-binding protein [Planctomycetota bacterium]